jgi:hypothetical protein
VSESIPTKCAGNRPAQVEAGGETYEKVCAAQFAGTWSVAEGYEIQFHLNSGSAPKLILVPEAGKLRLGSVPAFPPSGKGYPRSESSELRTPKETARNE